MLSKLNTASTPGAVSNAAAAAAAAGRDRVARTGLAIKDVAITESEEMRKAQESNLVSLPS